MPQQSGGTEDLQQVCHPFLDHQAGGCTHCFTAEHVTGNIVDVQSNGMNENSEMLTENQRTKRSDDDDECGCGEDDDACWEDFLLTGECRLTGNVGGPSESCECEDWDDDCWTCCLEPEDCHSEDSHPRSDA